ncbi:MAG: hypothetical protein SO170_09855 [Butyribacter sp.]|nr:hypothetical protein [bacterium]MDY3855239.1 hypothetical protein [Butyribacter sp.]
MKLEFVPKFITLLAGAVVSVITIAKDMDATYSLELLLATLIIFYIIGLITEKIIRKVMDGNMFVKEQDAQNEESDTSKNPEDSEKEEASNKEKLSGKEKSSNKEKEKDE